MQNQSPECRNGSPHVVRSSKGNHTETLPEFPPRSISISLRRDRIEKAREAVERINRILVSNHSFREILHQIKAELTNVLKCDRTIVVLFDGISGYRVLSPDESRNEPSDLQSGPACAIEGTVFQKVIEAGMPLNLATRHGRAFSIAPNLTMEETVSLLIFPLTYRGKIFGAVHLAKKAGHFSERHVAFLDRISAGLAILIQNRLLLEEMKSSEERYRTVLEEAHEGVLVAGEDYRFKYVNRRFADITGYTREELMAMDLRGLLDEEGRGVLKDLPAETTDHEETFPRREVNLLRKNGESKQVEVHSKLVKDSRGGMNAIAFVNDLTEKNRIQEQWVQTEKLRALGEMASGVAHDFNNALAVILGNTQLVLYTLKDAEARGTLQTIEKVAKDAAQTVRRLQEFTRKDIHQELFPLDLNTIVKDAIQITRPKWKDELQGKGIHIEMLSRCGEIPPVKGNASELREVITNMIFNAIEAMPEGGKIEIRTFRREEHVTIQIADTGTGMPEQVRNKAFEPFFTTKPFSNTGLGLSMSYGIIKRLGGEIGFETAVGRGTTFDISLPVAPA